MAQRSMPRHGGASGLRRGEAAAGWLFTAPVIAILGVFLLVPVLMALWVSMSDWAGRGSPLSGSVSFVGADNFSAILTDGGLATKDFGTSLRNNAWYVVQACCWAASHKNSASSKELSSMRPRCAPIGVMIVPGSSIALPIASSPS